MFKRSKIGLAVLTAIGGAVLATSSPVLAQSQTVEVTGSRIKRVDAEGSVPVTVISREELEASGAVTVAEFMRTVTFSSSGNFRPQSGSSAQSFASMDLRGLGSARTLVLLDGRRLPKGPMVGDAPDINIIPMAAVERIEILTDGASAVYGSDAIGGVVNVITRKDFEGIEAKIGTSRPSTKGGDRNELSAVMGFAGEKGRALFGVGATNRDMVFTSQRPWGQTKGVSTYGNNYGYVNAAGAYVVTAVPGGCEPNKGFWTQSTGRCSFDFNSVAADEAEITNRSFFMRGDTRISKDWTAYLQSSVSQVKSFGRYAPTPGYVLVSKDSPNNPTRGTAIEQDIDLYHRFAAAGNRDTSTDNNLYDVFAGVQGAVAGWDLDVGVRHTESQYYELGRNYIVGSLAEQAINSGAYNIVRPYENPASVLQGISATINRDSFFKQQEMFANASRSLFKMNGGQAQLSLGAEWRKEDYKDQYDSLQEAGVILGSAGNSAGGDRTVRAVAAEMLLPLTKTVEATLAARYEKYSDYGNDFSPKAQVSWKAMNNLKVRASYGQGFRAPSLPILTQKTTFSAESVNDYRTCVFRNGPEYDAQCRADEIDEQVDTYYRANKQLKSEQSKQYSFGAIWDVTPTISVKADYWNIKIEDTIVQISAQDIINRDNGSDPLPIPAGLGITRNAAGVITRIDAGYANEGKLNTDGLDIRVDTSFKFGKWGDLRQAWSYSRVLSYETNGTDSVGLLGLPKDRAVLANLWSRGPIELGWNINYIGKNGSGARVANSYVTHDLQANWMTPIKGGKLTVGVINAGNKQPELINYDGRNFNFYLYDSYGRTPYVRYTQKF